jgi:hypothetical protein
VAVYWYVTEARRLASGDTAKPQPHYDTLPIFFIAVIGVIGHTL